MVYITNNYHCGTCHKSFTESYSAESCEVDHIVEKTTSKFKQSLEKMFGSSSKIKAKLKPFRRKLK